MATPIHTDVRHTMRQQYRQARRELSDEAQHHSALTLSHQLTALADIRQAKCIAAYLPNDGEISPLPFIQWCWQQDIQICLPVLHPFSRGHLLFLAFTPDTRMQNNRFGIPEPVLSCQDVVTTQQLDAILMPLVAFDLSGNRLGMGGGFYDRTLTKISQQPHPRRYGLAHNCQQAPQLPRADWDVPVHNVVTPKGMVFSRRV